MVVYLFRHINASAWLKANNESPAHRRALTDGRGCNTRCQLHIRSNLGVQYLAQGHVAQSHPRGARILTSNFPLTNPPALPTELLITLIIWTFLYFSHKSFKCRRTYKTVTWMSVNSTCSKGCFLPWGAAHPPTRISILCLWKLWGNTLHLTCRHGNNTKTCEWCYIGEPWRCQSKLGHLSLVCG